MRRFLLLFGLLGCLAAANADEQDIAPATVRELLTVTIKLSRYDSDYGKPLPAVHIKSAAWFLARPECRNALACAAVGIYGPQFPNDIFIREGQTPQQQANVIVHELTHWLQHASGWADGLDSCSVTAAHEAEAYVVQYLFTQIYQESQEGFFMPDHSCKKPPQEPFGVVGAPTIDRK